MTCGDKRKKTQQNSLLGTIFLIMSVWCVIKIGTSIFVKIYHIYIFDINEECKFKWESLLLIFGVREHMKSFQ